MSVLRDGSIACVGLALAVLENVEKGTRTLDLQQRFVMPVHTQWAREYKSIASQIEIETPTLIQVPELVTQHALPDLVSIPWGSVCRGS